MQGFDQSALFTSFSRPAQNITDLWGGRPWGLTEGYFQPLRTLQSFFSLGYHINLSLTLGYGEVFGEYLMCKGYPVLLQICLIVVNFIQEVVVMGIGFPEK